MIDEAQNESDKAYIQRTFFEKFKSFGRHGKAYRDKATRKIAYDIQRRIVHPEKIFEQASGPYSPVYNLCPVSNHITHLIWFDIDSTQSKGFRAANKLMGALRKYGFQPELAQSSKKGHFHISIWFERPQSTITAHGICKQLLITLKLEWVEFGPHWGKFLRPWHFSKQGLKSKGVLWERGAIAEDLKPAIQLYYDYRNRPKKAFKDYPDFNIDDYLPTGPKGPKQRGNTNEMILAMVWNARVNSIGDEKILEFGKEMYIRGKIRGTLNSHLNHVKRVMKACYQPKSRISFDDYWSCVPPNLSDVDLIQSIKLWTIQNSELKSFPLTVSCYQQYRGIGRRQALEALRGLEASGKLVLFKRGIPGKHGKATLYAVGPVLVPALSKGISNNYVSLPSSSPEQAKPTPTGKRELIEIFNNLVKESRQSKESTG